MRRQRKEKAVNYIRRGNDGPVAVQTTLGWVLNGPVNTQNEVATNLVSVLKIECENSAPVNHPDEIQKSKDINETLNQFWMMESTGIVPESKSMHCDKVLEELSEKIVFNGERYEAPLPWKQGHKLLPDNYENSKNRLHALLKRLRNSPKLLKEYDEVIKDQEVEGIIEKIPMDDENVLPGRIHYVPHHPVIRNDKDTSKLRVVQDCSSKFGGGPSLNECLETGPNLLLQIIDIILKFRCYKIGLISDIRKAFLNIGVALEDRDVLRFLWVEDINELNPKIVVGRFAGVYLVVLFRYIC